MLEEELTVLQFMVSLEHIVQCMADFTCSIKQGPIELNLLDLGRGARASTEEEQPKKYKFEVTRKAFFCCSQHHDRKKENTRTIIIKAIVHPLHHHLLACKVCKKDDKQPWVANSKREVYNMAQLKNCIFAHLVPSLHALTVLQGIVGEEDRICIEYHEPAKAQTCPRKQMSIYYLDDPDSQTSQLNDKKIEIWLDHKDRLNVKGGVQKEQTTKDTVCKFDVDDFSSSEKEEDTYYYYYENPFQETGGDIPILMPATLKFVSYVLGSLGLHSLHLWKDTEFPISSYVSSSSSLLRTTKQRDDDPPAHHNLLKNGG